MHKDDLQIETVFYQRQNLFCVEKSLYEQGPEKQPTHAWGVFTLITSVNAAVIARPLIYLYNV